MKTRMIIPRTDKKIRIGDKVEILESFDFENMTDKHPNVVANTFHIISDVRDMDSLGVYLYSKTLFGGDMGFREYSFRKVTNEI